MQEQNDDIGNDNTLVKDIISPNANANPIPNNQSNESNNPLPQLYDQINNTKKEVFIADEEEEEKPKQQIPIQKLKGQTIEEEYNELLAKANELFNSYRYSIATPAYLLALDKSKSFKLSLDNLLFLYEQLSICYEKEAKYKEAIDYCYMILSQIDQKHLGTYQRILTILLSINEIQKAKELIDYIMRLYKNDVDGIGQFKSIIHEIEKKNEENKIKELIKINKEKQRKWFNFLHNPWLRFTFNSSMLLLGSYILAKYTYRR